MKKPSGTGMDSPKGKLGMTSVFSKRPQSVEKGSGGPVVKASRTSGLKKSK